MAEPDSSDETVLEVRHATTQRDHAGAPTLREGEAGEETLGAVAFLHERLRPGELLGQGGLGQVWLANEGELRRDVAVKQLLRDDPASRARFVFEARVAARLDHPGVVPVYELTNDARGRPLMVMKRVRGQSLAEVVTRLKAGQAESLRALEPELAGPPAAARERLIEIFDRVCAAVASAHARGVIHRDLKPDNVMLGAFGEVLVLDWGLAKLLDAPPASATGDTDPAQLDAVDATGRQQTRQGALVGTPMYMAPEQADGLHDAMTARSDVYALGAMLYELLALEAPFEDGLALVDLLTRVKLGKRRPLTRRSAPWSIPRELASVVDKAMAVAPAQRYADVSALRADIAAYRALLPLAAHRRGLLESLIKRVRRRPALATAWAFALLLLATLAAGGAVLQARAADAAAERERNQAALALAATQRLQAEQAAAAQRREAARATRERVLLLTTVADETRLQISAWLMLQRRDAKRAGVGDGELLRRLPMPQTRRAMAAFESLFAAADQGTEGLEVTVRDCELVAWLARHRLGDVAIAHRALTRGIAIASRGGDPAYLHYLRGQLSLEERDRFAEAEADFSAAIERYPRQPAYRAARAVARAQLARGAEAVADAERAIALGGRGYRTRRSMALALRAAGQLEAATAAFTTALAVPRTAAEKAQLLADRSALQLDRDDVEAAVRDARSATQTDRHLYAGWRALSTALQKRGAPAERAAALREGGYACLLATPPSPARARRLAELATTVAPKAQGSWLLYADVARTQKRWADAARGYSRALSAGDRGDARGFRALCRLELGQLDGAETDATRALQLSPRSPWARLARGRIRLARGQLQPALDDLRAIIKAFEVGHPARLWLARALRQTGDPADNNSAAVLVDEVIAGGQVDWRAWQLLAEIETARGDPNAARRAYRKASRIAPAQAASALAKALAALDPP